MKKFLIIAISIFALSLPLLSSALELQYPTINGYTLSLGMDLNKLVLWFYYFMISISGFAAFVMIVWGGVVWLTSAGNPSRTSEAKDRVQSALIGLLLILSSFLILKLINPDLTVLTLPTL